MNTPMYFLLAVALLAANLPFLTSRFLLFFQVANKRFRHHLFEWLLYFLLMGILAYVLESIQSNPHHQEAVFYVIALCLFAIFAFPAFVWRYFWRHRHQ